MQNAVCKYCGAPEWHFKLQPASWLAQVLNEAYTQVNSHSAIASLSEALYFSIKRQFSVYPACISEPADAMLMQCI